VLGKAATGTASPQISYNELISQLALDHSIELEHESTSEGQSWMIGQKIAEIQSLQNKSDKNQKTL
jgi:hypothetical protein